MKKYFLYLYFNCAVFIVAYNDGRLNSDIRTQHYFTKQDSSDNNCQYFCDSEVFYHDYMINEKELEPVKNFWNSAKINESATLQQICLQRNGLPVTRKCLFNSERGAEWEPISNWTRVKCIKRSRERIITPELNLLHEKLLENQITTENRRQVIKDVHNILEKPKYQFLPADIYYTTQILHNVFENSTDAEVSQDVVSICNSVMSMKEHVLRKSAEVNSTNKFLEHFENYMNGLTNQFVPTSRCGRPSTTKISSKFNDTHRLHTIETIDFSYAGIYAHLTANISIFYINPKCTNITGIAIYDLHSINNGVNSAKLLYESQGNFLYRFLYTNESISDLMKEPGLQVASFVPERLWKIVQNALPANNQFIVVKFYSHDSLFVQTSDIQTCRPSGKIISISIPEFTGRFPESLPFLIRNQYYDPKSNKSLPAGTGCGYWNYKTWLKDDVETRAFSDIPGPVVLCFTKHLTQFSFLLGGNYRQEEFNDDFLISPFHERALNIISIVGCSLSLLGLIGIWITAALFRAWRSLSSTKLLLNMCFALTLQMVLVLFVNMDDITANLIKENAYYECIALGALLQYSILVLFTWMLIIAFLQFQRYVTVIGFKRPPHYILKSAIAAWGFPLLPTLIVVFLDPDGFMPKTYEMENEEPICYPSGYGLTFGIILPIAIICITNLTIFIFVFYNISHTLSQTMNKQENLMVVKQIRLSVLLFFLLGLCWIFGIFSYLNGSLLFSYLFCLTASLQGFVIFMYFVVFSDVPRKAWYELICSRKQHKDEIKVREMQSITTSSALENGSDRR